MAVYEREQFPDFREYINDETEAGDNGRDKDLRSSL